MKTNLHESCDNGKLREQTSSKSTLVHGIWLPNACGDEATEFFNSIGQERKLRAGFPSNKKGEVVAAKHFRAGVRFFVNCRHYITKSDPDIYPQAS